MKKSKLGLLFLSSLALVTGVASTGVAGIFANKDNISIVKAETATLKLDKLGAGLGSTSNTDVSTTTVNGYTLNYLQGKKQGDSILLAKSTGAFISNKTAMPGDIKSVKVSINSGAAGKATYHCAFSTTECTSAVTTGSTAVNITGGNSYTYTNDVSGARYFCISLGNANNGQVLSLEIEYENGGSSEPGSVNVTGVTLDTTVVSLDVGGTKQLTATVAPSNADNKNVTWSSSNQSVATVSSTGLITAVSEGTATITVKTEDGNKTATCAVSVYNPNYAGSTIETALTPAQAKEIGLSVASGETVKDVKGNNREFYIKGVYHQTATAWSDQYKNISFYLGDNNEFEVYRLGKDTSGAFTSIDDLQGMTVGDVITVKTTITNYRGTTIESPAGEATLISVEKATIEIPDKEEPEYITKTVSELKAVTPSNEQLYIVSGKVSGWYNENPDATSKGTYKIVDSDGNEILVYNSTATESALTFDKKSGTYTYSNPNDFLTNNQTKDIKVGYTVTLRVYVGVYNSVNQLYGIVTNSVAPSYSVDSFSNLETKTQLSFGYSKSIDGDAVENAGYPVCDTTSTMSSSGNNAADVGLSDTDWNVTTAKNDTNNYAGLNREGTIRLYSNIYGNGTSITFENKNAKIVKSITVTRGGNDGGQGTLGVFAGDSNTPIMPNSNGSYTINSSKFTIQNIAEKASAKETQVHIANIAIDYGGKTTYALNKTADGKSSVGISFGTFLEKGFYDDLASKGATFGMFYAMTGLLSNGDDITTLVEEGLNDSLYTLDSLKSEEHILHKACTPVRVDSKGIASASGDYYQFGVKISNISEGYFDEGISAVAYAELNGKYYVTEEVSYSVNSLAAEYLTLSDKSSFADHIGAIEWLSTYNG